MLLSPPAMYILAVMANKNLKEKTDKAKVDFPYDFKDLRESVGQELEGWGYIKDYALHGEYGFSCTLLKKIR